jgi:ABC-type sugar transport system ATPase subunit
VGHNGAGKSTLLRVFAGVMRPEMGHLRISGRDVAFDGPADAISAGVSTVYQELSLLPQLTIVENTFLGAELTSAGILKRRAMEQETRQLLKRFELDIDPLTKLADLGIALRQLVEIAVAVHRNMRFSCWMSRPLRLRLRKFSGCLNGFEIWPSGRKWASCLSVTSSTKCLRSQIVSQRLSMAGLP